MKSLKINDTVLVISGDHKGTKAKIVGIDREKGKACLEGVEVKERHLKRTQFNPKGGKKTVHLGIDFSNLKLVEVGKSVKADVKKVDKKADKKAEKEAKKLKKGAK